MRKIIKWMMVLVMAVGCAAAMTIAAEAATEGDFTYSVSGGKATITAFNKEATGEVVIPDTIGGYPVTVISGRAFENCTGLTSVTIPEGVTSIGDNAFSGCSNLTSVTIPKHVTSIEKSAFYNCRSLTKVNAASIEVWCGIRFANFYANPLYYAQKLFIDGEEVTDVTIPEGVASIGDHAFFKCGGLKSVTIPASIKSIGKYAFSGCEGLTDVTIPGSVTNICDGVFSKCSGLTGVTIPEGVTDIGSYTFDECRNITSLTIPEGVKSIGDGAFYDCIALSSIELPSSLEKIGDRAFSGCTSLGSVIYKGSDDEWERIQIGNGNECLNVYEPKIIRVTGIAFDKNTITLDAGNSAVLTVTVTPDTASDKSVTWESSDEAVVSVDGGIVTANASGVAEIIAVTNDGAYSAKCKVVVRGKHTASESDLEYEIKNGSAIIISYFGQDSGELEIPDTLDGYPVTIIGDNAFGEDDEHAYPKDSLVSVKKIILPQTLKEIGKKAFSRCENLSEINIPESLEYIGQKAFSSSLYENDEYWIGGGFYIDGVLLKINARKTGVFNVREGTKAIASYAFSGCDVTEVFIPDSVCNLYAHAFANSDVETVNIPESMQKINDCAFAGSKIREMSIPGHVSIVGDYAFSNSGLRTISVESDKTEFGKNPFSGCEELENIVAPMAVINKVDKNVLRNYLRSVTLTTNASVDNYAFSECKKLTEINIPSGVSTIGSYAFSGCERLQTINLLGELETIGYRAFADCTALTRIDLPNGLKAVGDEAFSGCTGLNEITIPGSVERFGVGALQNTQIYNDAKNWENGVLYSGDVLIEASGSVDSAYVINDGTRLIANRAFTNNESLESVTMPDSVADIGYGAFYNCINLKHAIMSGDVKEIGYETFSGCINLEEVNIPEGVKYIGPYAFSGCSGLSRASIPDTVANIGEYAFSESGLETIRIPGSIASIGNSAFSGCQGLKKAFMCEGITIIGNFAFFNCTELNEISFPESLVKIQNRGFDNCVNLGSIKYYGSKTEWEDIVVRYGNEVLSSAEFTYLTEIPVTGIALDKSTLTLDVGSTAVLTAAIKPDNAADKSVTWSSSDESVASVDNGVVTAVSAGSAVITAESADGSVTAECAVTVNRVIDADTPVIKAKSARGTAGKTVRVEISVKNNPGMWGLDAVLNYDKSVMTLKDVENGTVFDDSAFTKGNLESDSYILSYENPDIADVTDDGVLAILIFEIKDTAEKGNYSVTLKYAPGDIINSDEKMVDFCIVNGGVEVTDVIPGDVTGDGVVNKMDALRLKKYLAGLDVEIDLAAADVNCDGVVNKMDALRLKKYLAGQDVKLGE